MRSVVLLMKRLLHSQPESFSAKQTAGFDCKFEKNLIPFLALMPKECRVMQMVAVPRFSTYGPTNSMLLETMPTKSDYTEPRTLTPHSPYVIYPFSFDILVI